VIEGEIALTPLPQADGQAKLRPAVLLRKVPPFGDWLVCGVSTQLHHEAVGASDAAAQPKTALTVGDSRHVAQSPVFTSAPARPIMT